MSIKENGVPASLSGVIPFLGYPGTASEAAAHYLEAFGGEEESRVPNPERPNRFMHIQLRINGGSLMMCDHPGETGSALTGGHLQLIVADGQAVWDRAIAAGMTAEMPYARQFWGDSWGLLRDRFGVAWGIQEYAAP